MTFASSKKLVPALLALTVAGCGGGSQTPATQGAPISQPSAKIHVIISSCGYKILIGNGQTVTCRFHEPKYRGKFSIEQVGSLPFLISPNSGNRKTKFTISAQYSGSGYFTVTDSNGNQIKITVRITQ